MASLTDLFGRIMNTPILCAGSNDISIEKNENLSLEGREGGGVRVWVLSLCHVKYITWM